MNGNRNGLPTLAKYSKLPIERIRYLPDAVEGAVREIKRGILFQIAFWSCLAFDAFADLTEVISKLDSAGNVELVVVDIDGLRTRCLPCRSSWAACKGRGRPLGSAMERSSPPVV